MVVVVVVNARTAPSAKAADAVFRKNGRAANMREIVLDRILIHRPKWLHKSHVGPLWFMV